jgi:hypothetical protein
MTLGGIDPEPVYRAQKVNADGTSSSAGAAASVFGLGFILLLQASRPGLAWRQPLQVSLSCFDGFLFVFSAFSVCGMEIELQKA